MSTIYEIIDNLCAENGISGSKMCDDLGMSRSTLTELRKGRAKTLNLEKASKIADYFGVSVDYLLGNAPKEKAPVLTSKDERDIEKRLAAMVDDLDNDVDGLMFSGEPLDDETRELLRVSLRNQLEISKRIAKQKYTPKKYRKEGD